MSDPGQDLRLDQHVLCVDDDGEFLKSLEFFLPEHINRGAPLGIWYRFLFFQGPGEALAVLQELHEADEAVAMLISDQKMPQMKGTEFLAAAREISPRSIRVLLTGHAGLESAIVAINEGLLDKYLTKPIDNEHDFTVVIQHLLRNFAMQRTIEGQTRTLTDLYGLSNALNAMDDVEETLRYTTQFARSTLECAQVCLLLHDGDGLRLRAAVGLPGNMVDYPVLPLTEAEARRMLGALRTEAGATLDEIPWPDPGTEHPRLPLAPPILYAGLASGDQFLGFIGIGGREKSAMVGGIDHRTLSHIASTASIAIHNQVNRARLLSAYAETRAHAAALAEANSRLQILDRLKSDFLTFICHELRTPLSGISAVELLDRATEPGDQNEMIGAIRSGYKRLEQFVAKGLEYFEWFSSNRAESAEITDLAELVRAVAPGIRGTDSRTIELELRIPDEACPARIQATLAHEILSTLVANAVKFSGDAAWVRVEVARRADRVTLTVSDRGQGFPPEWAPEVFRPFTIVDSGHHQRGTALNLAKTAAMVEAHGGRIHAQSAGPGRGAVFTVELPAAGTTGEARSGADPAAAGGVPRPEVPDRGPTFGPDRAAA